MPSPSPPISHHDGTCLTSGPLDVTLRVHVPPEALPARNFTFPPLPAIGSTALAFVLAKATIALSPGCVDASGLASNADNGPGTRRNLWIGRYDELASESPLRLDQCGCGVAFFTAGSGGTNGDNLRYIRHLAAQGYSVIAPDTMSAPASSAYPRRKALVPSLATSLAGRPQSYWCKDEDYTGGCTGAYEGGPYAACFSSKPEWITYDPSGWAAFYERIFTLRKRELDTILDRYEAAFGPLPARVFLSGNSEGAMVASRYTHPKLRNLGVLKGRILTAWSCEYNYFVSCAAHADLADPSVPVLNLLSTTDEFFAAEASVAARVASAPAGAYGDWPLTGSCAARMRKQGVRGAALVVEQPYHDNMEQAGSLYRMAANRFLRDPEHAFDSGVLVMGDTPMPQVRAGAIREPLGSH